MGVNPQLDPAAIQLPRLNSPRQGPYKDAAATYLKARRTLTCPPQEEVTHYQSRLVKGGYSHMGVPPIASRIVIANGQLPTDSIGAGQLIAQPTGLQVSLWNRARGSA